MHVTPANCASRHWQSHIPRELSVCDSKYRCTQEYTWPWPQHHTCMGMHCHACSSATKYDTRSCLGATDFHGNCLCMYVCHHRFGGLDQVVRASCCSPKCRPCFMPQLALRTCQVLRTLPYSARYSSRLGYVQYSLPGVAMQEQRHMAACG